MASKPSIIQISRCYGQNTFNVCQIWSTRLNLMINYFCEATLYSTNSTSQSATMMWWLWADEYRKVNEKSDHGFVWLQTNLKSTYRVTCKICGLIFDKSIEWYYSKWKLSTRHVLKLLKRPKSFMMFVHCEISNYLPLHFISLGSFWYRIQKE